MDSLVVRKSQVGQDRGLLQRRIGVLQRIEALHQSDEGEARFR